MTTPHLSLIVPAYKQQSTIAGNIRRLAKVVGQLRYTSEIIVVVDGTEGDETFSRAKAVVSSLPSVQIIGYPDNRGKGAAVRFGMAKARGHIVAFIDAGTDINPNGLSMMLEHFEWYKADIVVGSKRHPVSKVNYPWQRKILSFGYQNLVRILFGLNVRDTQVGLKCYRRVVLEKVLPRLLVKTYAFDIEILAVAYYLGFHRIYEAPVEIELDFGGSSILTSKKIASYIYHIFLDTLAVFYRLHIVHYYDESNAANWLHGSDLSLRS